MSCLLRGLPSKALILIYLNPNCIIDYDKIEMIPKTTLIYFLFDYLPLCFTLFMLFTYIPLSIPRWQGLNPQPLGLVPSALTT